jgi:hypothetical protein
VLEAVRALPDLQAKVKKAERTRAKAMGGHAADPQEGERALARELRELDERHGAANAELAMAM